MAQTTAAISFIAATVDVSTDNSTWVELDGYGVSIAVSGGDRNTGTVHTFAGDTPILKSGKRNSHEVTVRAVYTEDASGTGAWETVREAYETVAGPLYVRYSPKGRTSTYNEMTTGCGIVKTFEYPQGEAGAGDPACCEFTVECAYLTTADVA